MSKFKKNDIVHDLIGSDTNGLITGTVNDGSTTLYEVTWPDDSIDWYKEDQLRGN